MPDNKHTHFLHELQERGQGFQVEVLEWATAEDERLEMAIAAQILIASQPIANPTPADTSDPNERSMKVRAQWASDRRAAVRADAERAQQEQRRQQASEAIEKLRKQRDGLAEQRDIQFAQCAQWFYQRAAKYNRARTGWFGLKVTGEPRIPAFEPVSFVGSRPDDINEIGDSQDDVLPQAASSGPPNADSHHGSHNEAPGGST